MDDEIPLLNPSSRCTAFNGAPAFSQVDNAQDLYRRHCQFSGRPAAADRAAALGGVALGSKEGQVDQAALRVDNPARLASTDDPQTWSCFSNAVKAVTGGRADGIGFALTNSEIAAIDLDHCRMPKPAPSTTGRLISSAGLLALIPK